jgi:hypothetical protein
VPVEAVTVSLRLDVLPEAVAAPDAAARLTVSTDAVPVAEAVPVAAVNVTARLPVPPAAVAVPDAEAQVKLRLEVPPAAAASPVSAVRFASTPPTAATSGGGPLSQNGHLGFGFSRPVVGPKLGIA